MSDGTIGLPADGAGKKLDTEELSVGGTTVQRERMQLAGATDVAIAAVTNSDPSAASYAIVVREAAPDSVQSNRATATAVSAGSAQDLDSTQITSSKTGKLIQLIVSASVPFKVDLKTVLNGSETNHVTLFPDFRNVNFEPRTKEAFTVAESATVGFDGFRATVTNLDTSEPADFYATFVWDEV